MQRFIIEFPLLTEDFHIAALNKRFEIARHMYNCLLTVTQNRYKEMIKTKRYRNLISSLDNDKVKNKPIWKEINQLRKEFRLTEYDFHADIQQMQHRFKQNIDSHTAQKVATHLWTAYDKLLFGKGKELHYKKYGELNSLESKSNSSGIRFVNDTIQWLGLKILVDIDYSNMYEYEAMQNEIAYCRIVRKYIKGKYKYYTQLVMKGIPPTKRDKHTGEFKHKVGQGNVGLDIGTSTVAVVSNDNVCLLELADAVQDIHNEKRRLQRKMDRSKRATNPNKFNEDGTINKEDKNKWIYSNKYQKCRDRVKELFRKETAIRKYQHEVLSNFIVSLGDNIYVEDMNFAGLQKRAKNTEVNDKGKFKNKKRFIFCIPYYEY